jgi:endoglucanase
MRGWWLVVFGLVGLLVGAFGCADEEEGRLGERLGAAGDAAAATADGSGAAEAAAIDNASMPPDGSATETANAPGADAALTDVSPSIGVDGNTADGDGAPASAPPRRPFGSHAAPYAAGILPSGGPAALDAAVRAAYDRWKQRYLTEGCGGHYLKTGGGAGTSTALTVSEGHGYGMLALALMAGHDPQAQVIFDGFVRVFRAFPSAVDADLMAWAIESGCTRHPSPASATDGDLDIAYALLLGHAQWGSAGPVDYAATAARILAAINRSDVNASTRLPRLGDWASAGPHLTAVRASDLMPGHFRAFAAASGTSGTGDWDRSVAASYALVAIAQQQLAPVTGLLPDFLLGTDGAPTPAPARFMEGDHDGRYAYNACRLPWRLGTDYLLSGDARARAALEAINTWFKAHTGGNPAQIRNGYTLEGAPFGPAPSLAFAAPLGVAAMTDPAHQPWLDALFHHTASAPASSYYEDTLALLSLIVMSGNWWAP